MPTSQQPQMSTATSIASMAQQLSRGFGIAFVAVLLHLSLAWRGAGALGLPDFTVAFAGATVLALLGDRLRLGPAPRCRRRGQRSPAEHRCLSELLRPLREKLQRIVARDHRDGRGGSRKPGAVKSATSSVTTRSLQNGQSLPNTMRSLRRDVRQRAHRRRAGRQRVVVPERLAARRKSPRGFFA